MKSKPPTVLPFTWEGDCFVPLKRFAAAADKQYVVGQEYILQARELRSLASHNHTFAALTDMWANLPEELTEMFPTPEHLRKHALIMTGWRNERHFAASTPEEALKFAAFLRPADEYALVTTKDNVVVEWTAKSMSYASMDRKTFQRAKDDVLGFVENLIQNRREDNEPHE